MALRIGYKASAEQFGPQELLEFGVHAERCGFDSVLVSDHFQPWRHTGGHAPFSFAWLAALGARTERVLLGVGTGESLNEVPPLGIAWPEFKERFARLREAIQLMRRLWSEQRVSFDGTFYKTRNATVYDTPAGGVPLYVAAGGPQMARYAGRVADGLICTSGKGEALYREQLLPAFEEGARQAGRDPASLDKLIEVKVSFDTDRQRALEDTRHWGALALSAEEKTGVEDPLEMERLADALPTERTASRWIVSTDPQEHVERIRFYTDLGFTHLVFHAPGPDQRRFLDLYAEHLLPRLRTLSP